MKINRICFARVLAGLLLEERRTGKRLVFSALVSGTLFDRRIPLDRIVGGGISRTGGTAEAFATSNPWGVL